MPQYNYTDLVENIQMLLVAQQRATTVIEELKCEITTLKAKVEALSQNGSNIVTHTSQQGIIYRIYKNSMHEVQY
jgi:hypothetical protein